jgi:hypothetical protein
MRGLRPMHSSAEYPVFSVKARLTRRIVPPASVTMMPSSDSKAAAAMRSSASSALRALISRTLPMKDRRSLSKASLTSSAM